MNERSQRMADMYAQGYTLREVGDAFGVTGERVRQLIKGSYGKPHRGRRKQEERVRKLQAAHARILAKETTLQEEAVDLGLAPDSLAGAFYELGLKFAPASPLHGTPYRYGRGCRCEKCSKAVRQQRLRRYQQEPPQHGTESAYSNWGCRCDPCRAAGSKANRRHRLARLERESRLLPAD
jgi:Sigma-70, region 4